MLTEMINLLPTSQEVLIYDIDTQTILYQGSSYTFAGMYGLYDNYTIRTMYAISNLDLIFIDVTRKGGEVN